MKRNNPNNCYIILIEELEIDNIKELRTRESHYKIDYARAK